MELSDTLYNSGDHAAREISRYIVIENCRQSSNDKIASRASFIFASFGEKGAVAATLLYRIFPSSLPQSHSSVQSRIQPHWLAVPTGRYAEARFLSPFGKRDRQRKGGRIENKRANEHPRREERSREDTAASRIFSGCEGHAG